MCLVFLPTVISKDAESESDAIVTAIGVDKQQQEYQLSLQVVVPTPSSQYNQKLTVVTDTGRDIGSCMSKISLRLGKQVGLSHCKVFIFSSDVATEGLTSVFDYLFRAKSNTQDIVLIHTPKSAKEFLTNSADLENNLYFSIKNKGSFNENYLYGSQTTLGMYYNDYLGPSKASIISTVELLDEKQANGDSQSSGSSSESSGSDSSSGSSDSSGESSGGESSQSGQSSSSKKLIVNKGKNIITKNGKLVLELTPEQGVMINWFKPTTKKGVIVLENMTEPGFFDNASVGVEIDQKETSLSTNFEKSTPVLTLNLKLYLRTIEISQQNYSGQNYKSNNVNVTEKLKNKIAEKVTLQSNQAMQLCKQNNVDVLGVYGHFNKYNNRQFKKYLKSLQDPSNYLSNVTLKVNVMVEEYL